jgi:hypothetical protein
MKKLLVAALAACTLLVTSCGGGASSDPKATLIAFFDAMGKKDMAAAKKLATKDSESMLSMMEMAMKMGTDKGNKDMEFDKSKMEFGEAKIEGDKATIPVKEKNSNESTNFTLRKEDGAWKVAFTKAGLMESNMDKIKEKAGETSDSLNKGMDELQKGLDELKKIDSDSLKKAMEAITEGVKTLEKTAQ